MKKKIPVAYKDANGVYFNPKDGVPTGLSIDELMRQGLEAIEQAMIYTKQAIKVGDFDRETIGNLKDLMTMLRDLKKEERDILDNLSTEDLEKLVK